MDTSRIIDYLLYLGPILIAGVLLQRKFFLAGRPERQRASPLLTREAYIRQLGKEICLYPKDLDDIHTHWPRIASLAEELLPQVPDIGFLSKKKRRMAYLAIERKLEAMVLRKQISRGTRGHVLLLMQYSSPKFRKAYNAGPMYKQDVNLI